MQAVRISITGNEIELRSFPFFALSLEHARQQIIELTKTSKDRVCPYTDIYQYASLKQEASKHTKCKLEKDKINIITGKKS